MSRGGSPGTRRPTGKPTGGVLETGQLMPLRCLRGPSRPTVEAYLEREPWRRRRGDGEEEMKKSRRRGGDEEDYSDSDVKMPTKMLFLCGLHISFISTHRRVSRWCKNHSNAFLNNGPLNLSLYSPFSMTKGAESDSSCAMLHAVFLTFQAHPL